MNFDTGYGDCGTLCISCDESFPKSAEDSNCTPRRHKNLYDDEPGIAFKLRKAERPYNNLPTATDERSLGLTPTPPAGSCCHNDDFKGRRVFTVSFGAGSVTESDECLLAQRTRCEGFWKFVDSHQELLGMIKEGHYDETKPPEMTVEPIDQTKKSNQCKEGEILKARHDALRAADKDRIMKRKIMMAELQVKSGQPVIQYKKPEKPKKTQEIGYTGCTDISTIFEEMHIFDRMTKNPVLTGPRSSVDGETPPPSAVDWDEEAGEGEYDEVSNF